MYDPDHSPIQIDSDEEEGSRASMSPAPLDIPIVTLASDIFDTDNSDSDLDFEGEDEGKIFWLNISILACFLPDCMVCNYTPKTIMCMAIPGMNI